MKYLKLAGMVLLNLSVLFAVGLSLQAQEPKKGGTLNVALWCDFQTLDWQFTQAHPTPHGVMSVYEGLFAFGKDFRPVPELAKSWKVSKDKMTWTFVLREGVVFHNGKEMTAEDVKASLERWKNVSPRGVEFKNLREIKIVDNYTVQLLYNEPIGTVLLLNLANTVSKMVIMPKEIAEASPKAALGANQIVGTGPYQVVKYLPSDYLKLKRFERYVPRTDAPNYEGGKKVAYLDYIIFWIVPETSTRVAGLETGEYDIIIRVSDTEYQRFKSTKGIEPVINTPPVISNIWLNHKKGPFSNINMRRAVQALINVEEVNRSMVASKEFWILDPSIYPPGIAYKTDEASEYFNQANIEKAKDLLKKAGYRGEPIKFLALRVEPTIYRACMSVAEQMKAAGINVNLLIYDVATWLAKRMDPNEMDMFITEDFWIDPSFWHGQLGGKYAGWFFSSETEEVFRQLVVETDFEKRYELGKELQRLVYEKVAFIPVGYYYRLKAKRSWVKDPEGNIPIGELTLHNVWLAR